MTLYEKRIHLESLKLTGKMKKTYCDILKKSPQGEKLIRTFA